MLLGDFNGTGNTYLDSTIKKNKSNEGKLPKSFFDSVKYENLEDVWRKWNPNVKDYTFYSASHKSFSRIDMIRATKDTGIVTKKIK